MLEAVGVWRLVRGELLDETGTVVGELFAPEPRGMLTYTADGHVFVHLSSGSRAVDDPREAAEPNSVYYGYCGTYSFVGGGVRHHVTIARDPAVIGKTLRRDVQLDGDTLILSWRRNESRRGRIVWERVGAAT